MMQSISVLFRYARLQSVRVRVLVSTLLVVASKGLLILVYCLSLGVWALLVYCS